MKNNKMKAKFIYEDIFLPKSKKELELANIEFKNKYGTNYSDINETIERLKKVGVYAIYDIKQYSGIKIELIRYIPYCLYRNIDGKWHLIGEYFIKKMANEAKDFLENQLNLNSIPTKVLNEFKIEFKEVYHLIDNMHGLKLLAKLEGKK